MDKSNYIPFATVEDLNKGKRLFRSFLGKNLGLFMRPDGGIYALEMTCKHQGANLSNGRFAGNTVECRRHAWRYDLQTGKCVSHPDELPLRFHDTFVEDGKIWVCRLPSG